MESFRWESGCEEVSWIEIHSLGVSIATQKGSIPLAHKNYNRPGVEND